MCYHCFTDSEIVFGGAFEQTCRSNSLKTHIHAHTQSHIYKLNTIVVHILTVECFS